MDNIMQTWTIEIEPDGTCDCCTGSVMWTQVFQLVDNGSVVELNHDHNGSTRDVYQFGSIPEARSHFYKYLEQRVKQEKAVPTGRALSNHLNVLENLLAETK